MLSVVLVQTCASTVLVVPLGSRCFGRTIKKVDGLSSVNRSVIAVVVKQAEEKLHTLNASLLNNIEV